MIRNAAMAALAILAGAGALAAQSNAADPWTRVPALPTTCYEDLEFSRTLGDLYVAVGEEVQQQKVINEGLSRKLQELGPQEIQRRMMDYMMKNPQKAMAMMEAQQSAATEITGGVMSADAAKKQREAEFEQLAAAFKAEMEAAAKPFLERQEELVRTGTRLVLGGAAREFTSQAGQDAFDEEVSKQNADYVARCAAWYGPNGKLRNWLASYRSTVIDPGARSMQTTDGYAELQLSIFELPGAGFRSTAQLDAVRAYVLVMRKAYDLRLRAAPPWSERR